MTLKRNFSGSTNPNSSLKKEKTRQTNAGRDRIFLQFMQQAGIPLPAAELKFHPVRNFRFDFAWPQQRVALEIEGALWKKGGGGHSHPSGIKKDIEKYNLAAICGWRILRVVPEDLLKVDTINLIKSIL